MPGIIEYGDKNNYVGFSPHFQIYLKLIERQVELWPVWRDTEIALRRIVTAKMTEEYGEQWIAHLEKNQLKLRPIFVACRESQAKEQRSFGCRASCDLIDFTYLAHNPDQALYDYQRHIAQGYCQEIIATLQPFL